MWKPLEQPECYRKAGAAHGPAAPLLARVGKLIMTLLSSLGWLWITSPVQKIKPCQRGRTLCFSHLLLASAGHSSDFSQGRAVTTSASTVTTRVSAHQPPDNNDQLHMTIPTAAAHGRKNAAQTTQHKENKGET